MAIMLSEGRATVLRSDLIAIDTDLGRDYVAVCVTHRWASALCVSATNLPYCPHCELAMNPVGQHRYAAVERLLLRTQVESVLHVHPATRDISGRLVDGP